MIELKNLNLNLPSEDFMFRFIRFYISFFICIIFLFFFFFRFALHKIVRLKLVQATRRGML